MKMLHQWKSFNSLSYIILSRSQANKKSIGTFYFIYNKVLIPSVADFSKLLMKLSDDLFTLGKSVKKS